MALLDRDGLAAKRKIQKVARVTLPDGDELFVRHIALGEARQLGEGDSFDPVLLLLYACCDEAGTRLFSDTDRVIAEKLPLELAAPIIEKAVEINALKAGAVEVLEKNSAKTPDSSSSIGSPAT